MNGNINILMNFINHHLDNKGKFLVFDNIISYPKQQKTLKYNDENKFIHDLCNIIYAIGENKGRRDIKEQMLENLKTIY